MEAARGEAAVDGLVQLVVRLQGISSTLNYFISVF
jgi:hypothetical protein